MPLWDKTDNLDILAESPRLLVISSAGSRSRSRATLEAFLSFSHIIWDLAAGPVTREVSLPSRELAATDLILFAAKLLEVKRRNYVSGLFSCAFSFSSSY